MCFIIVGEYAKSLPRMRQKPLIVPKEPGDFKVLSMYDAVSEYANRILTCTENTLQEYKRLRKYAKSILSYIEDTPIDIKSSFCTKQAKNFYPKSPSKT